MSVEWQCDSCILPCFSLPICLQLLIFFALAASTQQCHCYRLRAMEVPPWHRACMMPPTCTLSWHSKEAASSKTCQREQRWDADDGPSTQPWQEAPEHWACVVRRFDPLLGAIRGGVPPPSHRWYGDQCVGHEWHVSRGNISSEAKHANELAHQVLLMYSFRSNFNWLNFVQICSRSSTNLNKIESIKLEQLNWNGESTPLLTTNIKTTGDQTVARSCYIRCELCPVSMLYKNNGLCSGEVQERIGD
jgi:hypothetical protein